MMLVDEHPGYPMVYTIENIFDGRPNRVYLEQALKLVLERHPLLSACVRDVRGYPHWIPLTDSSIHVVWMTDEGISEDQLLPVINLKRESGLRLWVIPHGKGVRIIWGFHHACCDAIGAFGVIGEWMAVYNALFHMTDYRDSLPDLNQDALLHRATFPSQKKPGEKKTPSVPTARWKRTWSSLKIARNVLRSHPWQAGNGLRYTGSEPLPVNALLSKREMDYSVGGPLRSYLLRRKTSLNNLLIANLFRTLSDWNGHTHGVDPSRFLRVTVPVSKRLIIHRNMPAANVLSYVFIDRHEGACVKRPALLNSITGEMLAIRRQNLSRLFVHYLSYLSKYPALMRFLSRRRILSPTAVLSMVVPLRHFRARLEQQEGSVLSGNMRLLSIHGAPPARPGTGLAMTVIPYADKLNIALRCDPKFMSDENRERFLDLYCENLRPGIKK
jgi:hypothetical protein